MSDDLAKSTRYLSIPEILFVNLLVSTTIALQIPLISFSREKFVSQPLPFHFLWSDHPWAFIVCVPILTTAGLLGLLKFGRRLFPNLMRTRFIWALPPRGLKPPAVASLRPAVFALLFAFLALSLLTVAASHAYLDRTQKPPVLKWSGPMVGYLREAAIAGYFLTAVSIVVGAYALIRSQRLLNILAVFALIYCVAILLATWAFFAIEFD
jgi:hypothetical protein